jgi:hypothetical protein
MMKKLICLLILCVSSSIIAQQGINYKALIKDNTGNVVANDLVVVQFIIYEGVALTNSVYQETHTPTTDTNGLVSLVIGSGTVNSGVFNAINWKDDTHYLNVQINTGSGLVDLGTTEFNAVPYAKHSQTADTALNVSGLEALDEGNGIGWRLIGSNPDYFGDIGLNAVDLSVLIGNVGAPGATGNYSFAAGYSTLASGFSSIAIGNEAQAQGNYSTALGYGTIASGERSTALGSITNASGDYSTVMGGNTAASGDYSTAMGYGSIASGNSSTALGNSTTATGEQSTAIGTYTTASGIISTAMGYSSSASGYISTAFGQSTLANKDTSTAMGAHTIASGSVSTVMGRSTRARSYSETTIGIFNTDYTPISEDQYEPADRLFVIGNGTNSSNRNNALTVLKNGKFGFNKHNNINALLDVDFNSGISEPHISLKETEADYARINFSNTNRPSDYWAIAGLIGATQNADRLNFYNSDQGDVMSLHGNGNVYINGSLAHSSDKRLKRDIETIPYGLQEILQLEPVAYNWKKRETKHKSLGLLAQDVQKLIKNIVLENNDDDKTLSVSYTELIPVLIKAIQEQQDIINAQKLQLDTQAELNENQNQQFKTFLKLLEALENQISH